ncbi:MAG TPA: imidazolonepropionase, partial [Bacteroidales bacterium]|nr:imidazolonepropionase [Bacteroidales bacterium]
MKLVIKNIKELVQVETNPAKLVSKVSGKKMSELKSIKDAFLIIDKGVTREFGAMKDFDNAQHRPEAGDKMLDACGRMVFPCFCDSHTHLVYAGSREKEYIDKIRGLSYEEIAKRGGGILNSAKRLHNTSEEELLIQSLTRLEEIKKLGTGAVEIKSGYGLTTVDELKMLRVIKKLKTLSPLTIRATFLGAHAVPLAYKGKQGEYVDLIINEMIPLVATEELADYIDVFCDRGFFTVEETERMLMA